MAALLVETHCVWVRVVLDGPTSPLVQLLDLFGESVGRWVGGLVGWWVHDTGHDEGSVEDST